MLEEEATLVTLGDEDVLPVTLAEGESLVAAEGLRDPGGERVGVVLLLGESVPVEEMEVAREAEPEGESVGERVELPEVLGKAETDGEAEELPVTDTDCERDLKELGEREGRGEEDAEGEPLTLVEKLATAVVVRLVKGEREDEGEEEPDLDTVAEAQAELVAVSVELAEGEVDTVLERVVEGVAELHADEDGVPEEVALSVELTEADGVREEVALWVELTEGEGEPLPETVPLGLRVPEALDVMQPEPEEEGVAADEAEKEPVGEGVAEVELLAVGEHETVAVARVGIFTVHTCMESASWGVAPPPPAEVRGTQALPAPTSLYALTAPLQPYVSATAPAPSASLSAYSTRSVRPGAVPVEATAEKAPMRGVVHPPAASARETTRWKVRPAGSAMRTEDVPSTTLAKGAEVAGRGGTRGKMAAYVPAAAEDTLPEAP